MQFVKLNRSVLLQLKAKGYNLLVSNQPFRDDVTIYWYPERVDDVLEYLIGLDVSGAIEPMNEPNLLPIQEALDNINEGDLVGFVWME